MSFIIIIFWFLDLLFLYFSARAHHKIRTPNTSTTHVIKSLWHHNRPQLTMRVRALSPLYLSCALYTGIGNAIRSYKLLLRNIGAVRYRLGFCVHTREFMRCIY